MWDSTTGIVEGAHDSLTSLPSPICLKSSRTDEFACIGNGALTILKLFLIVRPRKSSKYCLQRFKNNYILLKILLWVWIRESYRLPGVNKGQVGMFVVRYAISYNLRGLNLLTKEKARESNWIAQPSDPIFVIRSFNYKLVLIDSLQRFSSSMITWITNDKLFLFLSARAFCRRNDT